MKNCFRFYLFLSVLTLPYLAQSQSNFCYLTSTIIYHYTGASFSTSTFLPSAPPTTSSNTITNAPQSSPSTLSNAPGFGSLATFLGSSVEQSLVFEQSSLLSGVPIGGTTTSTSSGPVTATSAFYISVNVSSRLRKRQAVLYVAFDGDNGILIPTQADAALFELVNGFLTTGGEFVSGAAPSTPYFAFRKSVTASPDDQGWSASASSIALGNSTFCQADDGSFYVVVSAAPLFGCGAVTPAVIPVIQIVSQKPASASADSTIASAVSPATESSTTESTALSSSSSSSSSTTSAVNMLTTTPSSTSLSQHTIVVLYTSSSSPTQGSIAASHSAPLITPPRTNSSSLASAPAVFGSSTPLVGSPDVATSFTISSSASAAPATPKTTGAVVSSSLSDSVIGSISSLFGIGTNPALTVASSTTTPSAKPTSVPTETSANVVTSTSSAVVATSTAPAGQSRTSALQTTTPVRTTASAALTTPAQVAAATSASSTAQPLSTGLLSTLTNALITSSTTNSPSSALSSSASSSSASPSSAASSSASSSSASSSSASSSSASSSSTAVALTSTTTKTAKVPNTASSSSTGSSTPSTTLGIPVRNNGKRGLAYTNVTQTQFYSLMGQNSQVSWAYDYYSLPNASDNVGPTNPALTYVPLLYNDASPLTSIWAANVNYSIANYGCDSILAFNEPDGCDGGKSACMTVAASVTGYMNFIQPFAGRVLLGAPAVTNAGPPASLTYLSYFLGNCTGCTIDFIPIHWYASPYSFSYLQSYVQQAYATGGNRPIWITELGMDYQGYADADVQKFMKNATTWLDAQSYVKRYSWFGDFEGYLLNADGTQLSAQGVIWNNYTGGYVYS